MAVKLIPDMLHDLREDHNLKQVDIAKILEISQQTYSTYERGTRDLPIRHLKKLADLYKVSADFIIGRSKIKNGPLDVDSIICQNKSLANIIDLFVQLDDDDRSRAYEYLLFLKYRKQIMNTLEN